ncbi:MAG: hypothetical protein V4501_06815 [Pseudomonadota bacterium]
MIAQRSEITLYQSIFYRDQYYKVLNWLVVEAVIIICLIMAILYFIFFHPGQHFYITTTSGQIMLLPKGS